MSITPAADATWLRRLLLLITAGGTAGLVLELLLLEHYEEVWQWAPLVVLVVALATTLVVLLRPARGAVHALRGVMATCIVAGVAGLVLHFLGNVEFERELHPELHGLALAWASLRGATPALAPGALAQLGLIGLAGTYRHPALAAPGASPTPLET